MDYKEGRASSYSGGGMVLRKLRSLGFWLLQSKTSITFRIETSA
jgi:hypothetical protein